MLIFGVLDPVRPHDHLNTVDRGRERGLRARQVLQRHPRTLLLQTLLPALRGRPRHTPLRKLLPRPTAPRSLRSLDLTPARNQRPPADGRFEDLPLPLSKGRGGSSADGEFVSLASCASCC